MVDKSMGSGAELGLNPESATARCVPGWVTLPLFALISPTQCLPHSVAVKTQG